MDLIMSVIKTLEQLVETHKNLLDIMKEKRTILVDGNIDGLQSILLLESSRVDKIQKLEEQRLQFVQDYFSEKGIDSKNFSLEDLLQIENDESIKNKLHSLAKDLRQLIKEITFMNESNQELIQTSLSYVQFTISMHLRKEPSIGYGPNNNNKNRYMSLLDAKI
jgi:flagellar biosynthesis/type III secretory pathway chaperone